MKQRKVVNDEVEDIADTTDTTINDNKGTVKTGASISKKKLVVSLIAGCAIVCGVIGAITYAASKTADDELYKSIHRDIRYSGNGTINSKYYSRSDIEKYYNNRSDAD